jgi:hypothetical protein
MMPGLTVWDWIGMPMEDFEKRIKTRTCPARRSAWDGSVGSGDEPVECGKPLRGKENLCPEHMMAFTSERNRAGRGGFPSGPIVRRRR